MNQNAPNKLDLFVFPSPSVKPEEKNLNNTIKNKINNIYYSQVAPLNVQCDEIPAPVLHKGVGVGCGGGGTCTLYIAVI